MNSRHTTRTVLLDSDGKIALLYVQKYGYYKIPGGGIEEGEDPETAAKREVREEVRILILQLPRLRAMPSLIPMPLSYNLVI